MTKAQMAERIAELEKEVEALKAGEIVETHVHYHYPQPTQTPYYWWPNQSPFYVEASPYSVGDSGIKWQTYNQDGV